VALLAANLAAHGSESQPNILIPGASPPDAYPCLSLVSLAIWRSRPPTEFIGVFDSPRKARNALRRIATAHELCHSLLGIAEGPCGLPGLPCSMRSLPIVTTAPRVSVISRAPSPRCGTCVFLRGRIEGR
jgi:hypothetical protein